MEFLVMLCVFGIGFLITLMSIVPMFLRQINQYERGVLFSLGKYKRTLGPGIHVIVPIVQSLKKIDIRTKTVDLQDQEAITKDNVSTRISAVLYYKISDAAKSYKRL